MNKRPNPFRTQSVCVWQNALPHPTNEAVNTLEDTNTFDALQTTSNNATSLKNKKLPHTNRFTPYLKSSTSSSVEGDDLDVTLSTVAFTTRTNILYTSKELV